MSDVHSDQLLSEVAALPQLPGVYRYFDAAGTTSRRTTAARASVI
jgi:hypothetical protein